MPNFVRALRASSKHNIRQKGRLQVGIFANSFNIKMRADGKTLDREIFYRACSVTKFKYTPNIFSSMNKILHKKANIGIAVLITVIVLIVLWWLLGFASRQCSYDSQCPADNYCGSDFKCHQHKVVERNVVVNDYSTPAAIIAIALIIAALIIKTDIFNMLKGKLTGYYPHNHPKHKCDFNCGEHPMYPQYKDMYWEKK